MAGMKAELKHLLKKNGYNKFQFAGQNKSLSSAKTSQLILYAHSLKLL